MNIISVWVSALAVSVSDECVSLECSSHSAAFSVGILYYVFNILYYISNVQYLYTLLFYGNVMPTNSNADPKPTMNWVGD